MWAPLPGSKNNMILDGHVTDMLDVNGLPHYAERTRDLIRLREEIFRVSDD
jgi:hypothetical protein